MTPKDKGSKRLFVLDTNILIHDPTSLFRFSEHDIFIPLVVLEELDKKKKGNSDVARDARQASRFLDELTSKHTPDEIKNGLSLSQRGDKDSEQSATGLLFFQTEFLSSDKSSPLLEITNDNQILDVALALRDREKGKQSVILVSKDINMRIKASAIGLQVEDYSNDKIFEDSDLLYSGYKELPEMFWDTNNKEVDSWSEEGNTFYRFENETEEEWVPNQFLSIKNDENFDMTVKEINSDSIILEQTKQYYSDNQTVWGITARNKEQNYALNLLMDPDIDFVSITGQAGTGKTLLALASGLTQVMEEQLYKEIIITRATVAVGDDIGFLPGTESEKLDPWFGAVHDNLEFLTSHNEEGGEWGRQVTNDLLNLRIKIKSMQFMRGRTFLNRYIIIDEAQNLTPKQMKMLVTRAGPGSKIIALGNLSQIDTIFLTEGSCGLTYAVDRFKKWEHSGQVNLRKGERSRLADFASENL